METNKTFDAKIILEQLGGKRFVAMTGAKNLIGYEHALSFQLPNQFAKKGINHVHITLTPMDDYTMVLSKIRGTGCTEIERYETVYFDQLQEIFTNATGLYTSLWRGIRHAVKNQTNKPEINWITNKPSGRKTQEMTMLHSDYEELTSEQCEYFTELETWASDRSSELEHISRTIRMMSVRLWNNSDNEHYDKLEEIRNKILELADMLGEITNEQSLGV
jgi:hypothetical protein